MYGFKQMKGKELRKCQPIKMSFQHSLKRKNLEKLSGLSTRTSVLPKLREEIKIHPISNSREMFLEAGEAVGLDRKL